LPQTKRYLRQAAEDSVDAYEIDPSYLKAYLRAAEAHLALNERTTVKLAVHELEAQLKDAQLTWEADWAD
jgi:multidrug resistance efflux pump